ncbi:MAG TPA: MFS transporter [Chloroflexota bacterium]|nr:MFS transporter [Chloroflexota bacterium]
MREGKAEEGSRRVRIPGLALPFGDVARPLEQPEFRRLWLSTFAWNFSRLMEMTVTSWVALELTGSPWLVAMTGVFRSAFLPVAGPLTGALSDRFDRVTLMKGAQWGNVLVISAVAGALLAGRGAYWQIVVASLWLGASWGLDFPSRRALMADLVGPERVLPAIVLDNWTMNVARVAGPLLAGIVLALWGGAGAYTVLALSFLLASTLLIGLSGPGTAGRGPAGRPSVWRDLAAGAQTVRRDAVVSAVLVITVLMNCFLFPYQQLLSVFAEQVLFVGPVGLGYMGAASGVGAVAALFVLPRLRSLRAQTLSFAGGSCLACLALLLFAGSRSFPLALLCLTVIGLGTSAFGTMQSTIILGRTSPAMRGRAMGLLAMAIGSAPIGAFLTGLMVERFGAPLALAVNGALCGVLVAAVAWRAWRRPGAAPDPARVAMVTPAAPDRGP